MKNDKKMNGNKTSNYTYNNEKITQADLGMSDVDINDPRIQQRKDAVAEDRESLNSVDSCKVDRVVDESYRIDDNSNYSTTAMEENKCLDEPMTPGVGTTIDAKNKSSEIKKVNKSLLSGKK